MNILLINGSKRFGNGGMRLNTTLQALAEKILESLGYNTSQTIIDEGYEPQLEVEKILKADALIYQMPAWWMGEPWIVKKYIDEVYLAGAGVLFKNDGRSRQDESLKYGSGGLCQSKKVMFSVTWNAPLEAFTQRDAFFEGRGVEEVIGTYTKPISF